MKPRTLILFIAISLFAGPAKSFYSADNAPMIKMMSLMMEMMSRLMLGGAMGNSFSSFPSSGLPLSMLPMSPSSGFSGPMQSSIGSFSQFSPFQQAQQASILEKQLLNNKSLANNATMNGIWQALSGDIMAIYYDTSFIWTDGKSRHLVGKLAIKNKKLTVALSASKKIITFQFYRENNQFAVKDTNGQMFVFKRIY